MYVRWYGMIATLLSQWTQKYVVGVHTYHINTNIVSCIDSNHIHTVKPPYKTYLQTHSTCLRVTLQIYTHHMQVCTHTIIMECNLCGLHSVCPILTGSSGNGMYMSWSKQPGLKMAGSMVQLCFSFPTNLHVHMYPWLLSSGALLDCMSQPFFLCMPHSPRIDLCWKRAY